MLLMLLKGYKFGVFQVSAVAKPQEMLDMLMGGRKLKGCSLLDPCERHPWS